MGTKSAEPYPEVEEVNPQNFQSPLAEKLGNMLSTCQLQAHGPDDIGGLGLSCVWFGVLKVIELFEMASRPKDCGVVLFVKGCHGVG